MAIPGIGLAVFTITVGVAALTLTGLDMPAVNASSRQATIATKAGLVAQKSYVESYGLGLAPPSGIALIGNLEAIAVTPDTNPVCA